MTKHSAGIIKTGFLSANKIQIRKGDSLGMACCFENETQINTYRPSTGANICKYFFDQYSESIDPPLELDFKHPKAKSKA